jgi:hypothetical protein
LTVDWVVVTFEAELKIMRIILAILILFSFVSNNGYCQYFYNDILATQTTNKLQQLYVNQKIKTIKTISKESDGSIINDFFVSQTISNNGNEITTQTQASSGSKTVLKSFYKDGKIVKTINEEDGVSSTTVYLYNNNLLLSVTSGTTDTFITTNSNEMHIWKYNLNGLPTEMVKIKNSKDTTMVKFEIDESSLVKTESWFKNGKIFETFYYYYNNNNQLTDIVRYNSKAQKMLPDFVFDYDTNGRINKMIQVIAGGTNYNLWLYYYNEFGLKTKEECFNKQKQLLGTVEYVYNN